jgi:hypothetical protein
MARAQYWKILPMMRFLRGDDFGRLHARLSAEFCECRKLGEAAGTKLMGVTPRLTDFLIGSLLI